MLKINHTLVLEDIDEEFLVLHYQDSQSLVLLCKDLIPVVVIVYYDHINIELST